jgi:AraC-like DNA-binding protein
MLHLPPGLLTDFLVIDVHDPDEMGRDSSVSCRFPRSNNAHRYRLRHRLPVRTTDVLTRLAMRTESDLMPAYVADRYATEVEIVQPGVDRICVSTMLTGSLELRTTGGQSVQAIRSHGLVLRGDPGTRFLCSDGNARFNLWVDGARVDRTLAAFLDTPLSRPLEFQPGLDLSTGPGASLLRLMRWLADELAQPDGLASNPLALDSFTDMWVHALLHGVPHSLMGTMDRRHHGAAVPRHIKRAEEFMRENVARPVCLTDVAAAAGCSLRTLHAAFRQFRDTTPLAALHGIRLEAVRSMLETGIGTLKPMDVARLYGFTHPGRFKAAYLRRFGVPPAVARRRGTAGS